VVHASGGMACPKLPAQDGLLCRLRFWSRQHDSPRLKETCLRQVVLRTWFPPNANILEVGELAGVLVVRRPEGLAWRIHQCYAVTIATTMIYPCTYMYTYP